MTKAEELDLSGMKIDELGPFGRCKSLKRINLRSVLPHAFLPLGSSFEIFIHTSISDNRFVHLRQLEGLYSAPCLEEIDLTGNPVTKLSAYRATVIERCRKLKVLDGMFAPSSIFLIFVFPTIQSDSR